MRAVTQMFLLVALYMCTAHMCAAFAPGSLRMCTTPREARKCARASTI